MEKFTKRLLARAVGYEDCYHVYETLSGEYCCTIKVVKGADVESRVMRAEEVNPSLKKKEYLRDYQMVYVGTFPMV